MTHKRMLETYPKDLGDIDQGKLADCMGVSDGLCKRSVLSKGP